MKENQSLRSQLEEMKITLKINKEMLSSTITKKYSKKAQDILLQLHIENQRLEELNTTLHSKLALKETKVNYYFI